MNSAAGAWAGLAIIVASGVLNATFPLPMKHARAWKWENTWLAFCTLALLVLPVAVAAAVIPGLAALYRSAPLADFLPAVAGGLLWGTAQVTFGIAIARVGMAMAFAIVVGMCSVLGSLLPMLVQRPEDLLARPGLLLMTSAAILTMGLVLYAQAARRREQDAGVPPGFGDFRRGLALCLFTGAAGGAINLGFAFSTRLVERAASQGAGVQEAGFAVWAVLLPAGYLPNLVYCVHLLRANRTVRVFGCSTPRDGLLAFAMAVLWLSGWMGYGAGAGVMGRHGTSVGFAAYMTALLLWSTCLGLWTGEWRHASRATVGRMRAGLAVILVSVLVLSAAL